MLWWGGGGDGITGRHRKWEGEKVRSLNQAEIKVQEQEHAWKFDNSFVADKMVWQNYNNKFT